jgi:hypothetical protein
MSKVSEKEFDMQCRLCTSTEEGHIQIFGPEGECRNLATKIRECLPVSVSTPETWFMFSSRHCFAEPLASKVFHFIKIEGLLSSLYRLNWALRPPYRFCYDCPN